MTLGEKFDIDQIKNRLRSVIAEQLGVKPETVTDSATLVDDLGADSLDAVEIVMAVEDEFALEITDESAEPFKNGTIQSMAEALSKATEPKY